MSASELPPLSVVCQQEIGEGHLQKPNNLSLFQSFCFLSSMFSNQSPKIADIKAEGIRIEKEIGENITLMSPFDDILSDSSDAQILSCSDFFKILESNPEITSKFPNMKLPSKDIIDVIWDHQWLEEQSRKTLYGWINEYFDTYEITECGLLMEGEGRSTCAFYINKTEDIYSFFSSERGGLIHFDQMEPLFNWEKKDVSPSNRISIIAIQSSVESSYVHLERKQMVPSPPSSSESYFSSIATKVSELVSSYFKW